MISYEQAIDRLNTCVRQNAFDSEWSAEVPTGARTIRMGRPAAETSPQTNADDETSASETSRFTTSTQPTAEIPRVSLNSNSELDTGDRTAFNSQRELLGTEYIDLELCRQRILSEDIKALIPSPPFTNSAMDGFAFCYSDVFRENGEDAKHESLKKDDRKISTLKIGETVFAKPLTRHIERADGLCVKIMTGGCLPEWADTVVPVESCKVEGDTLIIVNLPSKGSHVRHKAEDVDEGEIILRKESLLDPERIMVAASFGHSKIPVRQHPSIGVFTTGDELMSPGAPLKHGSIYNSSKYFLESSFRSLGLTPEINQTIKDEPEFAKEAIEAFMGRPRGSADMPQRSEADNTTVNNTTVKIIITTGAVSAGEKDFIPKLAREMGFTRVFHKVAIRPGKPVYMSMKKSRQNGQESTIFWLGLAGNAISTMVGFHFFVEPLLQELGVVPAREYQEVEIDHDFSKPDHLQCFFRAKVTNSSTSSISSAHVFLQQGSARVEASARANAYVVLPRGITTIKAGTKIKAKLI